MLTESGFRPAWWLPGAHLQTQFPSLFRRPAPLSLRRERIELPDGDFLDLDWNEVESHSLILVLHGLEGSARSRYAGGILHALRQAGLSSVLMNFRGCSGEPNRLPRSYHSGDTADLEHVVLRLRATAPDAALGVVGYSLGGNVLLKWLGEKAERAAIDAAVAVSVPFNLSLCADRLNHGLSRVYQWYLLRKLRHSLQRKLDTMSLPIGVQDPRSLGSLREFDEQVTAPLHGFAGAEDYYTRSSCRAWLSSIAVPTLILHATDDPFMTPAVVPRADELSPSVRLELSARGGHVGFVSGRLPWAPSYWLEPRICQYFHSRLGRASNSRQDGSRYPAGTPGTS